MMNYLKQEDAGKLLLRLTLGLLMLFHGISKIMNPDSLDFISNQLSNAGLPSLLIYGVFVGEVFAPVILIIGFHSRIAGLVIAGNMLFAIGLVHLNQIFSISKNGGWSIELQSFFLFTGLAIALLGSGKFAVKQD